MVFPTAMEDWADREDESFLLCDFANAMSVLRFPGGRVLGCPKSPLVSLVNTMTPLIEVSRLQAGISRQKLSGV